MMNSITDKTGVFRETLLYEISAGRYRSGDKLPSERLFCDLYNISRTTARRALEDLEQNGIIVRRPPKGAYVSRDAMKAIRDMQSSKSALSITFLMPSGEINNPLLRIIFQTCRNYLPAEIKFSAVFYDSGLPFSLRGENADIVIAHGLPVDDRLLRLREDVASMVLFNTIHEDFNYISVDNYTGGRLMAEYIVGQGHKVLGCIGPGGPEPESDFEQRLLGIRNYCEEAGVKLQKAQLSLENYFNLSASCHQALDGLMRRQPKMSAILGLYDLVALHICESLNFRGIKVPDDMSVMGFDDMFYSQYSVPPLVTVKYPAEAIGIKLAEYIQAFAAGTTKEIHEQLLPVLIERQNGSVKRYKEKSESNKIAVSSVPV